MSSYRVSRWERLLGGDLWRLRTVMRRLVSVIFSLIPLKSWREGIRDRFDHWVINLNNDKINYFVANYPNVCSEVETINIILENNSSIGRFGDGEFNMCLGRHKSFQVYDKKLVARLKEVLQSNEHNFLVGINTIRSKDDLTFIWKKFVVRRGNRVLQLLDRDKTYHSSTITTVFPKNQIELESHVNQLKKIWGGRKVLFVVGKNSRFFFLEELFNNISCHDYVYAPPEDAFSVYEEIMSKILQYEKDWLILISLGPTATVMAYDLFKLGYQAVDLGQTPSKYHKAKYGTLYP